MYHTMDADPPNEWGGIRSNRDPPTAMSRLRPPCTGAAGWVLKVARDRTPRYLTFTATLCELTGPHGPYPRYFAVKV